MARQTELVGDNAYFNMKLRKLERALAEGRLRDEFEDGEAEKNESEANLGAQGVVRPVVQHDDSGYLKAAEII
eukprot:14753213-Alexandrium_andersonii.AAC.1